MLWKLNYQRVIGMSKDIAYFCDCIGPHKPNCFLGRRLKIKYNEISTEDYLKDPEGWEDWIDKEMEERYGAVG